MDHLKVLWEIGRIEHGAGSNVKRNVGTPFSELPVEIADSLENILWCLAIRCNSTTPLGYLWRYLGMLGWECTKLQTIFAIRWDFGGNLTTDVVVVDGLKILAKILATYLRSVDPASLTDGRPERWAICFSNVYRDQNIQFRWSVSCWLNPHVGPGCRWNPFDCASRKAAEASMYSIEGLLSASA